MSRVNWVEGLALFAEDWRRTGISPEKWCNEKGYPWGTAKKYITIKKAKALLESQGKGAEKIANSRMDTANLNANSRSGKPQKSANKINARSSKPSSEDANPVTLELSFNLTELGLSARESIFVEEVHSGKKFVQAYINAGYESNAKTAYKEASRLVRKPHIQKALRILKTQLRTSYQAERDEIVQQLVAITRADPNRITQHRRVNCRYCWGEYHFYQWRDAAEFEEKKLEALARKRKEPSDAGGYGFESGLAPNPECPRCSGEGLGELHICDTNDLDVNEHTYFLGVKQTKNGIEVLTESKQIARAQLLKILELDKTPASGTTGKRGAAEYSPEDYRDAVARMEDEFKDLD